MDPHDLPNVPDLGRATLLGGGPNYTLPGGQQAPHLLLSERFNIDASVLTGPGGDMQCVIVSWVGTHNGTGQEGVQQIGLPVEALGGVIQTFVAALAGVAANVHPADPGESEAVNIAASVRAAAADADVDVPDDPSAIDGIVDRISAQAVAEATGLPLDQVVTAPAASAPAESVVVEPEVVTAAPPDLTPDELARREADLGAALRVRAPDLDEPDTMSADEIESARAAVGGAFAGVIHEAAPDEREMLQTIIEGEMLQTIIDGARDGDIGAFGWLADRGLGTDLDAAEVIAARHDAPTPETPQAG